MHWRGLEGRRMRKVEEEEEEEKGLDDGEGGLVR